ncbi:two-component system nitrogen regulation sensor histidine kinase NtrY [Sulfitobacter undariae]|uniref:histidine kinase n=2 Tax=Sulfitobacter undariae TaxID=1563671 RepID=A0A7W6E5D8_9RHOB|nr:two-component system nitrogen regulation sensor histidine kinase NtrY [Sulfitobacter undariae]
MAPRTRNYWLMQLSHLRRMKRVRNAMTFGLVVLGPLLALGTYLALGPLDKGSTSTLRLILLLDLIYILVVAALVLSQVARLVMARRAKSAGSRLHLRLTGVFALMALIPTVSVAVFAVLTINIGIEGWFSERVRVVVGNSLLAAQAYADEERTALTDDAVGLARSIDRARRGGIDLSDSELLGEAQRQIQRGLREAYMIDATGEIRARGDRSYLFNFDAVTPAQIKAADGAEVHLIEDWEHSEFRALVRLNSFVDRFLYVSRDVDGEILSLLDETQETIRLYQQLESERGRMLFEFGLLYLAFAVIIILAAVWLGLWFAERLSGPIGRLTGAAQRVGEGNLDMQVRDDDGDDEIAELGRYFNQMTKQLKGQRNTLLDNTRQIERRRRLFDSVLSSVTSGVVGLDPEGRVTFVNRSAMRLLNWEEDQQSLALTVAIPEFGPLYETVTATGTESTQQEIKVSRQGQMENLLVRMATRRTDDGRLEGYVVAFDDVTDLVSAQRMAAWGDVARRIAHEIKNPLTPIQLSAERIKRKFSPKLGEDADSLDQLTGVIIRQTGDLRRIVDEFSKFARMPEPERTAQDLAQLVRDAVLLQKTGRPDIKLISDVQKAELPALIDATMITQALTNLIKNAGEAIDTLKQDGAPENLLPQVHVHLSVNDGAAHITIADNGIGLPEDRARLFEPYVTTRSEGTGLGLPIVKKIIEEHGGSLILSDAPVFEGQTHFGAMAEITLPLGTERQTDFEEHPL